MKIRTWSVALIALLVGMFLRMLGESQSVRVSSQTVLAGDAPQTANNELIRLTAEV